MLCLWLLSAVHLVLWAKLQDAQNIAACDAFNRVLSLMAGSLVLYVPHSLMRWVLHCERVMGDWAAALLAEEAERARHDADASCAAACAGVLATNVHLSQRRADATPGRAKGENEIFAEIEVVSEDGEKEKRPYECREMTPEEIEMVSSWRLQASFTRVSSVTAMCKVSLALAAACILYAICGISGGWWPYCTSIGPSGLLRLPVADPHLPPWLASLGESIFGKFFIKLFRTTCVFLYSCVVLFAITLMRGEFRREVEIFRGYSAMAGFGLLTPVWFVSWLLVGADAASLSCILSGVVIVGYAIEPVFTWWIIRHQHLNQRSKVMEFLLEREAARVQLSSWRELCESKANNVPFRLRGRVAAATGSSAVGIEARGSAHSRAPVYSNCGHGSCKSPASQVPMKLQGAASRMPVESLRKMLQERQRQSCQT